VADGSLVLGVDASRNRSGGAVNHLRGILAAADPRRHGIRQVHLWSYRALLDRLPDPEWLVKHNPRALEAGLRQQVLWQVRRLPTELQAAGCDLLLNTDAGTLGSFIPAITMSRDMLSYEPGEMSRFGLSLARWRLLLLRSAQNRSLGRSYAAIFLTEHAARVIQGHTGRISRYRIIPHGVGEGFAEVGDTRQAGARGRQAQLLYVSNVAIHKHQWNVVQAVAMLRRAGFQVHLTLAGGRGAAPANRRLDEALHRYDPQGDLVTVLGNIDHDRLSEVLRDADVFVFASSCENMPNTLIEGMAAGLPIACSDRGPMPEILQDGGVYFHPDDVESIESAIRQILDGPELAARMSKKARELAGQYSWARCAEETWAYCSAIHAEYYNGSE
jgi:glycosyltransferase involved in cell wall biosynthesis